MSVADAPSPQRNLMDELKDELEASLSPSTTPRKRWSPGTRALVAITVLSAVLVGGMWLLTPRKYKSTGTVLVKSPIPRSPLDFGSEPLVPVEIMNRWVADQVFRIQQDDILAAVLRDADVRSTRWFQSESDPERLLDELKSDLDVRPARDANAFVVSFSTRDADDSKLIVERMIALYLQRMSTQSKANYMSQLEGAYRMQLSDLQKQRDEAEHKIRALAGSQGGVTGLAEGGSIDRERLRGLLFESALAEADLASIRSERETLRTTDPSQLELTPDVEAVLENDPEIRELKQEIRKAKRASASSQWKEQPDQEEARLLDLQIKSLQAELNDLLVQKLRQGLALQKREAERAYKNASDTVICLRELILAEQGKARDADTKLLQYKLLVNQQKSLDSQIARLNDYITQLRLLIDNDSVRTGVDWISHPTKADRPTLDYRIRFLTTLTCVCLAVPVVFALVLAIVRIVNWASRFAPPPRPKSLVA